MSPAFTAMPDVEAVCASALRAANVAGGRVYSSIPAKPTFPLVVVQRVGGTPVVRRRLDAAQVQVSAWGTTKSEAHDVAEAARRELHGMEATTFPVFAAYVTGVEDALGLQFLPDPDTTRDRYVFAVTVYAHAA